MNIIHIHTDNKMVVYSLAGAAVAGSMLSIVPNGKCWATGNLSNTCRQKIKQKMVINQTF